ncbi:hypothetical protein AB0M95_20020 [Sphaerisporangium sp. NPDC051017]|uniref:hypothetical protein n=1 Tax=Sphaerisporangium sp. NPDC051017 TaxID=3154636 RepID=UPI00342696C1
MSNHIKTTATRIIVLAVIATGGTAALATTAFVATAQPTAVANLADGTTATPTPTPTQNGNTPWG